MKGFDFLTAPISEGDDVSKFILIAEIHSYKGEQIYTQGHKYTFECVELNASMRTTRFSIYTANSSQTYKWYYEGTPAHRVSVKAQGHGLRVYIKPIFAYGSPIGINVTGQNPSSLIIHAGGKPTHTTSGLFDIKPEFHSTDYILHNNNTIPPVMYSTFEQGLGHKNITSEEYVNYADIEYNYKIVINGYSGDIDRTVLPADIWGAWHVTYEVGHTSATKNFALQKWECVSDSGKYYCYVRFSNGDEWSEFIKTST